MITCSISGCTRKGVKRTWCGTHYRRWLIHGDPLITKKRANGSGFIAGGYAAKQIDGIKKFDHVRISETALGRTLPAGAVVHHVDEDRSNNRNDNLVICPDRKYHNFLHMRINAMKACGDPNRRKCRHCQQYDDPSALRIYTTKTGSTQSWHIACANARAAEIRRQRNPDIGLDNRMKMHCPQGHPYSGDNLHVNIRGSRACRACSNAASKRSKNKSQIRSA